jgi:uncharacterized membrane protein
MKRIIIIASVNVLLFACSKSVTSNGSSDTTINCGGVTQSFSADVNPIIQSSCATGSNCHAAGSNSGPGELITYSEIKSASAEIRAAVSSGVMPKTGSLTASEKNAIICWIDNGSSNN